MKYQAELDFAKSLAKQAGLIMKQYFRTQEDLGHEWKEDNTPVTIADTTINSLVIKQSKQKFPEYGILGEEESYELNRDMIWVVDPIDGTVPFSLGIPTSAFSIALVERKDGKVLVAVTYDPFLDEMYWAVKNQGAFLNGRQIHTSKDFDLKRSFMSLSTSSGKGPGYSYESSKILAFFREQGTKTLNYMSFVYPSNRVASGQFAATVIGKVSAWDIAACALLVEEAGGIVTDLTGKRRRFDEEGHGCIMAANQQVYDAIMNEVRAV